MRMRFNLNKNVTPLSFEPRTCNIYDSSALTGTPRTAIAKLWESLIRYLFKEHDKIIMALIVKHTRKFPVFEHF